MTTNPPLAELVSVDGHTAQVRCPYCGGTHRHAHVERGHREHRAPGCPPDWPLPSTARATSHVFDVPQRATRPNGGLSKEDQ